MDLLIHRKMSHFECLYPRDTGQAWDERGLRVNKTWLLFKSSPVYPKSMKLLKNTQYSQTNSKWKTWNVHLSYLLAIFTVLKCCLIRAHRIRWLYPSRKERNNLAEVSQTNGSDETHWLQASIDNPKGGNRLVDVFFSMKPRISWLATECELFSTGWSYFASNNDRCFIVFCITDPA